MSEMLKVGFLSGIRHAVPYAELLAQDPRVQLVGIAEDAQVPEWMVADSRAAAASVGTSFYDRLDPLLEPGVADLLVVCSEPTRHAALAARALGSGGHVLVDKPVATSLAQVDALIALAEDAPGSVSVVNRLASPSISRLRRWIDAGHLGLPLHVDAEWFASGAHFATSVERPELVVDPSLSGGGELLNFLLYPVDYIRHLTGLEIVEVMCEAATLFSESHAAHGVEDTAVVSLGLERGVTASVVVGRIPAAPGLGPVSCTVRVLGSHGNASSDDDRPQVRHHTLDGGVSARPVGGPSSIAILRAMFTDLVTRTLAGHAPAYTLADARASLAVVEAAVASAGRGQPARLHDVDHPSADGAVAGGFTYVSGGSPC